MEFQLQFSLNVSKPANNSPGSRGLGADPLDEENRVFELGLPEKDLLVLR